MKKESEIAYEQALNLKMYEGNLVWSRSQTMLVVNTILIAAIGIFLSSEHPNEWVVSALAFLGLIICLLWMITSIRGFAFNIFWTLCAREHEESTKKLKLLTKGALFKDNEITEFNILDKKTGLLKRYQRPFLGRFLNTRHALYILISLFLILYGILLGLSMFQNLELIRV